MEKAIIEIRGKGAAELAEKLLDRGFIESYTALGSNVPGFNQYHLSMDEVKRTTNVKGQI